MFGPYHRRIDPPDLIEKIAKTGELKGSWPRNIFQSDIPKVKAFKGPLPKDTRGFEFETDVPPDAGCPPDQAYWSDGRPGVTGESDFVKIKVHVLKIHL
jgi:hypothetical protein